MENKELGCQWHFDKHGGRDVGPNNPMQENFKKTPYASLIRESIQNSLDARSDASRPVKVEFKIGRIQRKEYEKFFGIREHIDGCLKYYHSNDDAKKTYMPMLSYLDSINSYLGRLYYIQVADFNTKGMEYRPGDTNNPFYAFVRAAGVSSKDNNSSGGSYGYGKAAYFYMSPLRTIIVSTRTRDGRHFFEGVSSLCTHTLDGEKYTDVGYYDNNNGQPVTDINKIPERFRRTEPGTNIYVMGVYKSQEELFDSDGWKDEIYHEMMESVLRNFWMAIQTQKLEVKIDDTYITKENLGEYLEKVFKEEHDKAKREAKYNPTPYWNAVVNANRDKQHRLIEKKLPILGNVRFYVYKNKDALDKIVYMRGINMLVKAKRNQSENGFYGVFVCEDPKGNRILREMENPAHDEWVASNWKVEGKTKLEGKQAIDEYENFIVEALEEIFSDNKKEVQMIRGLENFLYIPTEVEDSEDYEMESLVGNPDERLDEEGNFLSTKLSSVSFFSRPEETMIGEVMIEKPSQERHKRDNTGEMLSGHGEHKRAGISDGEITTTNIDGRFTETDENDPEGLDGKTLYRVPVTYRAYAQKESGRIVHTIIIHSDYEIENGRIDLTTAGELDDDKIAVKTCSEGVPKGNTIQDLYLQRGKNILKIMFADNMKHAVRLEAYEFK